MITQWMGWIHRLSGQCHAQRTVATYSYVVHLNPVFQFSVCSKTTPPPQKKQQQQHTQQQQQHNNNKQTKNKKTRKLSIMFQFSLCFQVLVVPPPPPPTPLYSRTEAE